MRKIARLSVNLSSMKSGKAKKSVSIEETSIHQHASRPAMSVIYPMISPTVCLRAGLSTVVQLNRETFPCGNEIEITMIAIRS